MSDVTPSNREPEEPDRPPSDLDATFAEIVAGWDREPEGRRWPDAEHTAADGAGPADAADVADDDGRAGVAGEVDVLDPHDAQPAAAQPADPPAADVHMVRDDDPDEHFVPPEPPPFPFPAPHTLGAFGLFALGLVLLFTPGTIGLSGNTGLLLGMLSISGGGIWLAARLRQGPPRDSGWDDGAKL